MYYSGQSWDPKTFESQNQFIATEFQEFKIIPCWNSGKFEALMQCWSKKNVFPEFSKVRNTVLRVKSEIHTDWLQHNFLKYKWLSLLN